MARQRLVIDTHKDEEGVIEIDGEDYPVRTGENLDIKTFLEVRAISRDWDRSEVLESRAKRSAKSQERAKRMQREADELSDSCVARARKLVLDVIREQTPDADPPLPFKVLRSILEYLAGERSPDEVIAETLADGHPAADREEVQGEGDPTTSKPPSRRRRRSSATTTGGSRDGGDDPESDGATSVSISGSSTGE